MAKNEQFNPVVQVDSKSVEWCSDLFANYLSQVGSNGLLKQDLLRILLKHSPNLVSKAILTKFLDISENSLTSLVYQTRLSMAEEGYPLRGLVQIENNSKAGYRLMPKK